MDTFDWKLLNTLHETHNITKAARLLYLSQPTLTKRIQLMEEEFKTELMVRHSKGISFTPKGLFLAEKARQILNDYQEIRERLDNFSDAAVGGTLRIAANAPFARGELPVLIAGFHELYPKVSFDLQTDYSRKNYYKLCSGELPLGFIRENYSWPHEKLLVSEEKIYIICRDPFTLADLKHMSEIHSRFSIRLLAQFEAWWSSHFDVPPQSFITVEDSSIAVQYVKQRLGFTLMPGSVILGREGEFYRLPLISQNGRYLTRKTWLYYRNKSLENPVVQLFVSFLEDRLPPDCQLPDRDAADEDRCRAYRPAVNQP